MTAASRSLATALRRARFASGLLRLSYTTNRDTNPCDCKNHTLADNAGSICLS